MSLYYDPDVESQSVFTGEEGFSDDQALGALERSEFEFKVQAPVKRGCCLANLVQQIAARKSAEAYGAKGFAPTSKARGLVTLSTPSNLTPTTTPRTPITGSWERLSSDDRLQLIFQHASQKDAVAFSLNFTTKKFTDLNASGDPVRSLSRSINRAAKIALGYLLDVAFIFEHTAAGRLHVHGCAIVPAGVDLDCFRKILKAAGGKVTGLGSGRQCDISEMNNSAGWHGYCSKAVARTRRLLGTEKIAFVSLGLRQSTEAAYRAQTANLTHTAASAPLDAPTQLPEANDSQQASMSQEIRPDVFGLDLDFETLPDTGSLPIATMLEIEAMLDALN